MNWIKQNKFLSGFLAVMVLAVGALGYLLFSAKSHYDEVRTDYETKAAELNRLEGLKPYPETESLTKIDAQKKEHAAAIEALQKNLGAAQIAVEPISREQFQDRLREAVTRVATKAKENGVAMPTPFYLGMDRYQSEPPLPEAAPALGRQLKALEFVVTKMIDDGITGIVKFERDPLPEEEGKAKKEKAGDAPGKPGGRSDKPGKGLVAYHGLQLEFVSEQSRFRNFLNGIVNEKSQFFVPRLVVVKNEVPDAPSRVQPGVQPGKDTAAPSKYIFGAEKVNIALVLEIVDFAEVAAK